MMELQAEGGRMNLCHIYWSGLFTQSKDCCNKHLFAHPPPSLCIPLSQSQPLCVQSIDPGQQFTWEHSNLEVNKPKNRYANVIAYDHSRVILAPVDGEKEEMVQDFIDLQYFCLLTMSNCSLLKEFRAVTI